MSEREIYLGLLEASKIVCGSLDLHHTLQAIAEQSAKVTSAEASSVLLLDPNDNTLIFKAAFGQKADKLLGQRFNAEIGIAGRVVNAGKSSIIQDTAHNDDFFQGFDRELKFTTRNMLCAPMIHQNKVIGVIEVINARSKTCFDESDLDLLGIFANLAAIAVLNARQFDGLQRQNEGLKIGASDFSKIIGATGSLQHIITLIDKVAATGATVLILGETGTGKELIARTIHEKSPRAKEPFIAVNCAALPEGLLESELFGHEKGSFTGAVGQKPGRFELAEGGTIFLDEIGELTPIIQVKLLRVLQEKEFVRVGGTKTITADVRIIAATNRDLKTMMQNNTFREDLFYRLNVFPITLPPLRQRKEDFPNLIRFTLDKVAKELKVSCPNMTTQAMTLLAEYSWPGNIRELQNVIERSVLLSAGNSITPDDLPKEISCGQDSVPPQPNSEGLSLPDQEKIIIQNALTKNNGNQSKTARDLGISRDLLRYRIKKFGLQR